MMVVFLLALNVMAGVDFDPMYLESHYTKKEVRIPMRDGVRLFTSIYMPKDQSQPYPILMWRTPYSCAPYGRGYSNYQRHTWHHLAAAGYIIVFQDVRGRFMSEGEYVNMRPYLPHKPNRQTIDETTDTFDTVAWLLDNISNHNGRVGLWGISYPGFYASMAAIDAHPAIQAISPQAPIADWFGGDDWHHNGAMALAPCLSFIWAFGQERSGLVKRWPAPYDFGTDDGYQFFRDLGPLSNVNVRYFKHRVPFWNALLAHRTRDAFWQARDITPHLKGIKPAIMVVGGWFDAENLSGALATYRAIEALNPQNRCTLVMGPWVHGGWVRSDGSSLGDISFGAKTGEFYVDHLELPFFETHLKGNPDDFCPAEVHAFETGRDAWRTFDRWPPGDRQTRTMYLQKEGGLTPEPPTADTAFDAFVSDPQNPVPYTATIAFRPPKTFMIEDQRFAAFRPDVMVYKTQPLTEAITVGGAIDVDLYVATTGTDSDWVVKIIDVFPEDSATVGEVVFSQYQMLVRGDIFRAKFRHGLDRPEPIEPGEVTRIRFALPDVLHTFLKGHRIMVQIQCSWFPLFTLNPQTCVALDQATPSDFVKADQRVYCDEQHPSRVTFGVVPAD